MKKDKEVKDMEEEKISVQTGQLRIGECIEVNIGGEKLRVCKTREGAGKGEITIEKVSE